MGMNGVYGISPVLDSTPVRIENAEVEGRIAFDG
jgi:hypothetical protein